VEGMKSLPIGRVTIAIPRGMLRIAIGNSGEIELGIVILMGPLQLEMVATATEALIEPPLTTMMVEELDLLHQGDITTEGDPDRPVLRASGRTVAESQETHESLILVATEGTILSSKIPVTGALLLLSQSSSEPRW